MADNTMVDDDLIVQNNERGPGWFLKITYVVVPLFMLYYLFTYWNWKSNYQLQQEELNQKIQSSAQNK
jgi:hypothetical protein